jgi:hypothetical protein
MRKRVLGVLLCAMLLVGALPGVALATHQPAQRPFATITVVCSNFQTGHGTFTQVLPLAALHGSEISNANVNENTGSNCE